MIRRGYKITERLKDFPVRIDYLNRFRTAKQKTEAINGVNDGSVDIIIGTHQLTNQRLKFKVLRKQISLIF